MTDRTGGILFVLSAPSGTGKTTVAGGVVERVAGIDFSVSYTTRPPRLGERDGTEYHFIERAEFDRMIDNDEFLEHAQVFGHLYGTGLRATRAALDNGHDLLLDIDIQGARQVKDGPIKSVAVMILPPDYESLEIRLSGRGSEDAGERRLRLTRAREEVEAYKYFDYVVINREVQQAVAAVESIVNVERSRAARCAAAVGDILSTFPE